jgi:hypothetical protein
MNTASTEQTERKPEEPELLDLIDRVTRAWIALGPPWVREIGDPEPPSA